MLPRVWGNAVVTKHEPTRVHYQSHLHDYQLKKVILEFPKFRKNQPFFGRFGEKVTWDFLKKGRFGPKMSSFFWETWKSGKKRLVPGLPEAYVSGVAKYSLTLGKITWNYSEDFKEIWKFWIRN